MGTNQGNVSNNSTFQDCRTAIEFHHFFALGNRSANTRRSEEGGDAGTASAQTFGQRSLRNKLDLEFSIEELLSKKLVLTNIGRQHLGYLLVFKQQPKTLAIHAHIV